MSTTFDVAVVGATGLVGNAMIRILEERRFPVGRLCALASARSRGKAIEFRGESIPVDVLEDFDFSGVRLALFSAGGSVSAQHAPREQAEPQLDLVEPGAVPRRVDEPNPVC